ncbi:methyltransferase domain-containing protein [Croceicoccus sp. F390]|uniref:Methyltransferase domain-containing protein n=1 Tax=Croceicoccus esteveae TaxID=3075597 RepID=A0ABU2ZH34_9SPHN|nr:methyltransferase domain-containing protein [Croceicoccus sp. F390]MDT0575900.1 methyltransferase domain-containing protein [Croceicoccus sp. F390]
MLHERLIADELMDDPALDAHVYGAVLADLEKVNRATFAYRPTLGFLARALQGRKRLKLLDVGFGNGDMLRRIAAWAQRRGIAADLVGVDLNPRSEAAARRLTSGSAPISYVTGDYADLRGQGWDCIVSSLVAHHMTQEQLVAFLRFQHQEARLGWFINDLHRHGFAHAAYPLLARLMGWHPMVRLDGRTSIARSYRPAEWYPLLAQAGIEGAMVRRQFPFRLCVEWIR